MVVEDTASRVPVGFPLSLALLSVLFLLLCGFLCCCLHWEKFYSFLPCSQFIHALIHPDSASSSSPQKPELPFLMTKQREVESLPVLMPGDEVPKFIAMACPCQPHKDEALTIQIHNPDSADPCSETT